MNPEEQTVTWLISLGVLSSPKKNIADPEDFLKTSLKDGVVLCKLTERLIPGFTPKVSCWLKSSWVNKFRTIDGPGWKEGRGLIQAISTGTSPGCRPCNCISSHHSRRKVSRTAKAHCVLLRAPELMLYSTIFWTSVCHFLWSGPNVPHSSFEWVGVSNYRNGTNLAGQSAWMIERTPFWRAASRWFQTASGFRTTFIRRRDTEISVSGNYLSVLEMTKLIMINNSCRHRASLPLKRLRSIRCDIPLFQRRQRNWQQLTRIKPEVVACETYCPDLTLLTFGSTV